jgi:hypothetical protein
LDGSGFAAFDGGVEDGFGGGGFSGVRQSLHNWLLVFCN